MDIKQRSNDTLNYGVEMKRQGKYNEAIQLYKQSIIMWPDNPEIAINFFSMGKTFYLMGKKTEALACYIVFVNICIISNSDNIKLYKLVLASDHKDENLNFTFYSAFYDVARHIGHTLVDLNIEKKTPEILHYEKAVKGMNPPYSEEADTYNKKMIELGMKVVMDLFYEYDRNAANGKDNTLSLMNELVGSCSKNILDRYCVKYYVLANEVMPRKKKVDEVTPRKNKVNNGTEKNETPSSWASLGYGFIFLLIMAIMFLYLFLKM